MRRRCLEALAASDGERPQDVMRYSNMNWGPGDEPLTAAAAVAVVTEEEEKERRTPRRRRWR